MKFILPVALISILFPIVLVAQYDLSPSDTSQTPGIGRLNTISLFLLNSPAIGYRRCINARMAWSISTDLEGSVDNRTNRDDYTDTTYYAWSDNTKLFTVALYPQFELWFTTDTALVQPHVGFGPLITYSHQTSINSTDENRGYYYYTYRGTFVTNEWGIGLRVSLGMDVPIIKSVSLATRYDLSWTFGDKSFSHRDSDGNHEITTYKKSRLWLGPIQAGFAIHF